MDDHFQRMLEPSRASASSFMLKDKGAGQIFQPSKSFQGPRPGLVFKRGTRGVGYYEDFYEMKKVKDQGLEHEEKGAKRRRTDDARDAATGGGGGAGEKEDEADREEGEDEEAFLRKALESDDIDEETIKRILQVADKQQDVVELDLPGVKKLLLGLERRIQANLLKRVKFADEPAKFLESELELYEEIGQFKAVAAAPSLYPELVKLDVANTLLGLVTHENTDIRSALKSPFSYSCI
ncbi:hypothetical protein NSK_005144 [Nannochloropsis salina CCMP1776]|uniref:Beta-catenin-like protein 1 N-terminal domain-containing protein n=1 Tax=Nannochloropsis salina CCMP1776 TaxID=1027361 RepID=A0A4D9D644_9STRA|nr:hypothetical protein NSK_005144 [Nannochloropsis salina CCMP1776]|eukprot:TFJ84049.1 hypothetical protein NSK_005144 [Nannochloropsis salina CCMP1776]